MRKTLSVCIVVKNESKQIVDCLENITILADEIVLVDTGSTDGTPELVRRWAAAKNATKNVKVIEVGGKFHDAEGDFNFGEAKTFSFASATRDYVMWLDASDRVQEQLLLKKKFIEFTATKEIIITLPTATSAKHAFNRLRIAPRTKCRMVGAIHEYMWVDDLTGISRVQLNIPVKNSKPMRDLSRNLRILQKEWERTPSARVAFYLGNTLFGEQKYSESIEWFRKRIYSFEWADEYAEEYYKSLECIADCTLKIYRDKTARQSGINIDDMFDVSNEMIRREPTRVEGYYYLGLYHMERREYDKAMEAFRHYTECRVPVDVKLWLDPIIYKGQGILRKMEECKMAEKYKEPLVPEEILDFGPSTGGSYSVGMGQYEVGGGPTIF